MFGAEQFPKISTSTDLVPASNRMLTTTGGSTVEPMSPMDSVRELFVDMRDALQSIVSNTLETNELLKVAVLGTPDEQRREAIDRGETDAPPVPEPTEDSGPSFLDRLKGLNPFQSGIGTFGKVLLALAGLLGLKLFGPQIQSGFADLLKLISEGKISEKISEITTSIKDKIEPMLTSLKENFALFLEGVTKIRDIIVGLYTSITTYIDQFDTDGIEGLSQEEQDALLDDVQTKVSDSIMGVFSKLFEGLIGVKGVFTLLTTASILKFFAKSAPVLTAGSIAGLGLFGTAAIVAVAAAGIYSLYDRIQFALNDELDNAPVPDNIVDKTSDFVSKFLGGTNPEGGLGNALSNAGTLGLIGAVMGGIIGSFFGGVGAIPGAGIGFRIGTLIGAGFGFVGSDAIKEDLPSMQNLTDNVEKLRKFFFGTPTSEDLDIEELTRQRDELNTAIDQGRLNNMPEKFLNRLIDSRDDLNKRIEEAPGLIEADRQDKITALDDAIGMEVAKQSTLNGQLSLITAATPNATELREQINNQILESQSVERELRKNKELLLKPLTDLSSVIPNAPGGISDISTTSSGRIDEVMSLGSLASATGSLDNLIVGSNNTNQTNLSNINNFPGGFNVSNDFMTAVIMGDKKAKMS